MQDLLFYGYTPQTFLFLSLFLGQNFGNEEMVLVFLTFLTFHFIIFNAGHTHSKPLFFFAYKYADNARMIIEGCNGDTTRFGAPPWKYSLTRHQKLTVHCKYISSDWSFPTWGASQPEWKHGYRERTKPLVIEGRVFHPNFTKQKR